MNRKVLFTLVGISVLILSSCASEFLSYNRMGFCNKGDDISTYSEDGDVGDFNVKIIDEYVLSDVPGLSKVNLIFYETHLYTTNVFLIFPMPFKRVVYTHSVLAFEDDKLVFWGFPEEYMKSEDEKIRKIGSEISKILFENYL